MALEYIYIYPNLLQIWELIISLYYNSNISLLDDLIVDRICFNRIAIAVGVE
jgi:hypothetical protein